MTPEHRKALLELIKAETRRHKTKEECINNLQKIGVLKSDGELNPVYYPELAK